MAKYFEAVGRRKESTARVRLFKGKKESTVNGVLVGEFFTRAGDLNHIFAPLKATDLEGKYYFTAKVNGGGVTGQRDAIKLGIARALVVMNEELKPALKKEGLMTRDPRAVERKKYNFVKARKKPQFSKR